MDDQVEEYAPPSGPPPTWDPEAHEYPTYPLSVARPLRAKGWTVLSLKHHPHWVSGSDRTFRDYPDAGITLEKLFAASKEFFALPVVQKQKFCTEHLHAGNGSEEGYSCIEGEKEFITLRRNDAEHCPTVLKEAVEDAWESVGRMINQALKGVEMDLNLPESSLTRFAEPCLKMDGHARATMMRLFRYENDAAKVVAEPHCDLGLLSLVIGDTPGLEAWDVQIQNWNPIEQTFERGMATLMSGRQLEYLTRHRYRPGPHRVMSYGPKTPLIPANLDDLYPSMKQRLMRRLSLRNPRIPEKEKYRYSIVFVLRAHEKVPMNYSMLESPGFIFDEKDKKGKMAGDLFQSIKKSHYNININKETREQQKKQVLGSKHRSQVANNAESKNNAAEEATKATG